MTPFKPTSGLTHKGTRRVAETRAQEVPEPTGRATGMTADGMKRTAATDEVQAAPLTTQQRKSLDSSQFVFPDKAPGPGSYPISDRKRGANALSRSEGKPEEAAVKRAVCRKFGDLPECKESD